MTDMLIRGVPDDVLAAVDAHAGRTHPLLDDAEYVLNGAARGPDAGQAP